MLNISESIVVTCVNVCSFFSLMVIHRTCKILLNAVQAMHSHSGLNTRAIVVIPLSKLPIMSLGYFPRLIKSAESSPPGMCLYVTFGLYLCIMLILFNDPTKVLQTDGHMWIHTNVINILGRNIHLFNKVLDKDLSMLPRFD